MADETHRIVPEKTQGIQKNLKHDVVLDTVEDAEELFVLAKDRMLNVNHWRDIAESISAEFQLTDKNGSELKQFAHTHNYIRIKIPAPGTHEGDGYDWVLIEEIVYDDYPDMDYETFAMRVRPSDNPANLTDETAHFFAHTSTSTFVIERRGRHVTAHYHGRNEKANTENGLPDNIRNIAVALGAWLLGSDAQWLSLLKGLIHSEIEE